MAIQTMKRYFAFRGDYHYPKEGMADFVGDFDTLDDAIATLTEGNKTIKKRDYNYDWAVVWDSNSRSHVWDATMLLED